MTSSQPFVLSGNLVPSTTGWFGNRQNSAGRTQEEIKMTSIQLKLFFPQDWRIKKGTVLGALKSWGGFILHHLNHKAIHEPGRSSMHGSRPHNRPSTVFKGERTLDSKPIVNTCHSPLACSCHLVLPVLRPCFSTRRSGGPSSRTAVW